MPSVDVRVFGYDHSEWGECYVLRVDFMLSMIYRSTAPVNAEVHRLATEARTWLSEERSRAERERLAADAQLRHEGNVAQAEARWVANIEAMRDRPGWYPPRVDRARRHPDHRPGWYPPRVDRARRHPDLRRRALRHRLRQYKETTADDIPSASSSLLEQRSPFHLHLTPFYQMECVPLMYAPA
jgi:hypothetical protein